jgi:arginine/lysine/ornithine decarboxylase
LDPLRLTVSLQQLGWTGYQAAEALEQQHGIVVELATPTCFVLAMSIGSTQEHAHALVAAMQQLCQEHNSNSSRNSSAAQQPPAAAAAPPVMRLTPRDAFFAATETVPVEQAGGRVSAELLCPYPPGVPAVYPGEVITEEVLQRVLAVLRHGGTVTGCSDGSLQTLQVVAGP